ncbi:unnamed protein product [Closterium sp. NIES-54]
MAELCTATRVTAQLAEGGMAEAAGFRLRLFTDGDTGEGELAGTGTGKMAGGTAEGTMAEATGEDTGEAWRQGAVMAEQWGRNGDMRKEVDGGRGRKGELMGASRGTETGDGGEARQQWGVEGYGGYPSGMRGGEGEWGGYGMYGGGGYGTHGGGGGEMYGTGGYGAGVYGEGGYGAWGYGEGGYGEGEYGAGVHVAGGYGIVVRGEDGMGANGVAEPGAPHGPAAAGTGGGAEQPRGSSAGDAGEGDGGAAVAGQEREGSGGSRGALAGTARAGAETQTARAVGMVGVAGVAGAGVAVEGVMTTGLTTAGFKVRRGGRPVVHGRASGYDEDEAWSPGGDRSGAPGWGVEERASVKGGDGSVEGGEAGSEEGEEDGGDGNEGSGESGGEGSVGSAEVEDEEGSKGEEGSREGSDGASEGEAREGERAGESQQEWGSEASWGQYPSPAPHHYARPHPAFLHFQHPWEHQRPNDPWQAHGGQAHGSHPSPAAHGSHAHDPWQQHGAHSHAAQGTYPAAHHPLPAAAAAAAPASASHSPLTGSPGLRGPPHALQPPQGTAAGAAGAWGGAGVGAWGGGWGGAGGWGWGGAGGDLLGGVHALRGGPGGGRGGAPGSRGLRRGRQAGGGKEKDSGSDRGEGEGRGGAAERKGRGSRACSPELGGAEGRRRRAGKAGWWAVQWQLWRLQPRRSLLLQGALAALALLLLAGTLAPLAALWAQGGGGEGGGEQGEGEGGVRLGEMRTWGGDGRREKGLGMLPGRHRWGRGGRRGDWGKGLPRVALGGAGGVSAAGWRGTDVYEASSESERMGEWDEQLGLEVDVATSAPHLHSDSLTGGGEVSGGSSLQGPSGAAPQWYVAVHVTHAMQTWPRLDFSLSHAFQWLELARYSGVAHVFWYDMAEDPRDRMEAALERYEGDGFVTYHHFPSLAPSLPVNREASPRDQALHHCLTHHGSAAVWLLPLTPVDYLTVPPDIKPGFADRFLRAYEARRPSTSQLLLQTFLFLGNPPQNASALLIQRYERRTNHSDGVSLSPQARVVPVVRPNLVARVLWHNPSHLLMTGGSTMALPAGAMRVNRFVSALQQMPGIGRLLLPYLFHELSAFATVEDLVTHLCTSNARYRAALPAEFLDKNPPPMYITLYFIVTRLPDSLRVVRDQFLALDPTDLTIDLLEHHLTVGAARGTPRTPIFEGCSPSPLAPSYASASVAADILGAEDVGAASAIGKRRGSKGKGGRSGGGGSGGGSGSGGGGGGGSGGGGRGGNGGRSGGLGGGGGGSGRSGGSGSSGSGGKFDDKAERPRWAELLRSGVAIFDLDYDAILAAMYALCVSAEGVCYLCVPPDPSIEAAALGASESALPGTALAKALHTFTLDSGASRCFFCDSTTLTPLSAPVPVRLADPSGGPILACSSTVLPCSVVPSGSLSGIHLLSFSTNLVSTTALQDAMVTTTTPGGQRVSICTCTRTVHHLATFTRHPRSSLYTLATEPPQVAASAQVSASSPVAPPCSCCLLTHQTILWHHRLGHPSLPHLRGMHSRLLFSGLPWSPLPLPPSPAPPCLLCVEGRLRAAPHSSSFPPTTAPLQTLHMELRERFRQDLPVPCLHSDRGGEFSSDLLWDFCRGEGILQLFTLLASPQKIGIAERRIGLVMEVARTSMIHAAAPHFLWPFAVQYVAHQLNLWPRGPAPLGVSQVDPLLGTVPVEVAVDSGAARGAASGGAACGGAEPARVEPGGAEPAEPGGTEPAGVEPGGAQPEGAEPGGAEYEGAESGGAEPGGSLSSGGPSGALSRREPLSTPQLREWFARRTNLRSGTAGAGGSAVEGKGAAGAGGTSGFGAGGIGAGAAGVTGAAGVGGGGTGAGAAGDPGAAGPRVACTGGTGADGAGGAAGVGAGYTGAGGAGPWSTGAVGAGSGGTGRPRPYFVPLLQQVLGLPSSTGLTPPLLYPPPDQSQPPLQPASPLPAPSPYTKQAGGLTERCEPVSRPALPVRAVHTGRHVPRPRPPPVPGTHHMALRPSSVPQRVSLPSPPASSLADGLDPESNLARAASPTVPRLLASVVNDPSMWGST